MRLSSGIEHFARIASPRRWKDVFIEMLTVCFDAAGKTPAINDKRTKSKAKNSPVMVVAGFASQAGVWAEFDGQWIAVLEKYNTPFFHPSDFAHSNWPFDNGWKDEQQKRKDFQSELIEIIENCGLRKFGGVLWVDDYLKAKAKAGLSTDPTAVPYVLCSRSAVEDFNTFALGEGIREDIEYVFEKGDEEDALRKHFKKHSFQEPVFRWSKPVIHKGITQKPFLGLQAAGWIAWEYYRDFLNLIEGGRDREGRWALRIFEDYRRIPGYIKIVHKSTPLAGLLRSATEEFQRSFKAVAEATAQLEGIKQRAANGSNRATIKP